MSQIFRSQLHDISQWKKLTMERSRVNQAPISPTGTKCFLPDESTQSNPVRPRHCVICRIRLPYAVRLIATKEKNYCPFFIPPLNDGILDLPRAIELLLQVCFDGKLDAVKHIVEQWNVDVNAIGDLHPWGAQRHPGPLLRGVTPLIAAVANQHASIAFYLIGKGADLTIRTSPCNCECAGMTALQVALSPPQLPNTSYERRRDPSNWIILVLLENGADPSASTLKQETLRKLTEDESVTTMLIRSGMRIDQRDSSTALHYWAGMRKERTSFDVPNLLFAHLVQTNVIEGMDTQPLYRAVLENLPRPNSIILNFFLNHLNMTRQEKIDALELAGSALICGGKCAEYVNAGDIALGLDCWHRATRLRQEGGESFKKTPLSTITDNEWTTLEDLEEIQRCPNRRLIQCLLVDLRIMGTVGQGAVSTCIRTFVVKHVCKFLLQNADFRRFFGAIWKIAEVVEGFSTFDRKVSDIIRGAGEKCVYALKKMETDNPLFTDETFMKTLQLVTFDQFDKEADRILIKDQYDRFLMQNLCGLIQIIAVRPNLMTEKIMEFLHKLVRLDKRDGSGHNLLLYACRYVYTDDVFPAVKLLLRLGADPNSEDSEGNSALHYLAQKERGPLSEAPSVVHLLLQHGCHVDKVNKAGKIACEAWQSWVSSCMTSSVPTNGVESICGVMLSRIPSLACSSARIVRKNLGEIRTSICIPKRLERFILWH